jgi:acetoin utilization deacetylase AcuC-like enzyme
MGFCILNNVAVAAAHARVLGVERVAIVDWDVHHGNGTEEIFYDDPSVLYVSLHQAPFYPGTGAIGDVGTDEGAGYTVNIPLSASADLATYTSAIDRIVGPILSTYAPGLLLISAGYDAHARDPLGAMRLDDAAYGTLFEHLYKALPTAGDACRQRPSVGIVLEGGYDTQALEGSFRATLQAALACTSNPRSVYAPPTPAAATDAPSHTHRRQIALAQAVQQRYWPLT